MRRPHAGGAVEDKRAVYSSVLLVVGIFVLFLVLGTLFESEPSQATVDADRPPTTTTTTEPPPEGVFVVELRNGSFAPANLTLDLDVAWIVRWVNRDPRDVILFDRSRDKMFSVTLAANGGTFEWDYSQLEPAIWRYSAEIGRQLIPGQIDTRPEQ
jgi:hypothetical protein